MPATEQLTRAHPLPVTQDPVPYAWVCDFAHQPSLLPPRGEITGQGCFQIKVSDDGVRQARKASVNSAAVGLRLSQSGRETELNRNTTGQLATGLMANEQGEGSLDRKLPRGT